MKRFLYEVVRRLKLLTYGTRGEPYRLGSHVLRFVPGTRPVRLKYISSLNWVVKYDALEIKTLVEGVVAGDTIFDVGAHTGEYSILLSALAGPTGTVIAFEPDSHARKILDQNIALNPDFKIPTVEALAASDTIGEAVLFSKGGNANSSLVPGATGGDPEAQNESIAVKLTTLDFYAEVNNLSPKWIKIDTEGAEIKIIKGAQSLLNSDCNFLVELHPYAWSEFGSNFDEFIEAVSQSSRRIRYLDEINEFTGTPHYGVVILEKI
ncbi:MAG: putative methyltransferase [Caulobacteraceae bacterium]|nr:putative methyltransferase [Caulobacteraceae bacterium]